MAPAAVVERTGVLVGRAVASVANLLDLSLAVVSGSVALGFGAPFFAAAQAEMDRSCRLAFARRARVEPGGLGDRGPLVGAARVGLRGAGVDSSSAPGETSAGERDATAPGSIHWGHHAAVVARAVVPRPGLWWAAGGALCRMARRGWWRRAPYLPVPGEAYWRFRMETVYGLGGPDAPSGGATLTPEDVVAFLRWCQRSRPERG